MTSLYGGHRTFDPKHYKKYDERQYLFTDEPMGKDKRANLITKALKKCASGKVETKKGKPCSLITKIMTAEKYTQDRQAGHDPKNIHNEFMDFLTKSALFFRTFDLPLGVEESVQGATQAMKDYIPLFASIDPAHETVHGHNIISLSSANHTNQGRENIHVSRTDRAGTAENYVGHGFNSHLHGATIFNWGLAASGGGSFRLGAAGPHAGNSISFIDSAGTGAGVQRLWNQYGVRAVKIPPAEATDLSFTVMALASRIGAEDAVTGAIANGFDVTVTPGTVTAVGAAGIIEQTWNTHFGVYKVAGGAAGERDIPSGAEFVKGIIGDGSISPDANVRNALSDRTRGLLSMILHSQGVLTRDGADGGNGTRVAKIRPAHSRHFSVTMPDSTAANTKFEFTAPAAGVWQTGGMPDNVVPAMMDKLTFSLAYYIYQLEQASGKRDILVRVKAEITNILTTWLKKTATEFLTPIIDGSLDGSLAAKDGLTPANRAAVRGAAINALTAANTQLNLQEMLTGMYWLLIDDNHGNWWSSRVEDLTDQIVTAVADIIKPHVSQAHLTLEKAPAKNIWDNVFAKWDTLTSSAQNFYKTHIEVIQLGAGTGRGTVLDPDSANFPPTNINYKNYRLNLKKGTNSEETIFERSLPLLVDGVFDAVKYNDHEGKLQGHALTTYPPDDTLLRRFFRAIYKHTSGQIKKDANNKEYLEIDLNGRTFQLPKDFEEAKKQLATKDGLLGFNIDKEIEMLFYWLTQRGDLRAEDVPTDKEKYDDWAEAVKKLDEGFITFEDGVYYIQKAGQRGGGVGSPTPSTLFGGGGGKNQVCCPLKATAGADGKIALEYRSKEGRKRFKANHACYSSLYRATGAECEKYINECLLTDAKDGDRLDECLDALDIKNFREASKAEIKKLHPIVALRTLQRFGYMMKKERDLTLGMDLWKVESTRSWLDNRIKKEGDDAMYKDLKNNYNSLLKYLEMVRQYVNYNPQILNRDVSGETDTSKGDVEEVPEAWAHMGLPFRKEPTSGQSMYALKIYKGNKPYTQRAISSKNVRKQLSQRSSDIQSSLYSLTYGTAPPFLRQQNGGAFQTSLARKKYLDGKCFGSELLKKVFKSLNADLKRRGKTLNPNDRLKLEQKLQNFARDERELLKEVDVMNEYANMQDAFKEYKSEQLSLRKMHKLAERHNKLRKRVEDREAQLANIMEALEEAVAGEGETGDYKRINVQRE